MIKIGEGHKSEVFELPDGRILKLFFPHFAELAPQEAEIAKVLAAAGVRAPRVDETLDTEGRPGLVFGNLKVGQTISDAVRTRPWQIVGAARKLAEMHASVHERTSEDLPSQRERITQEIETAKDLEKSTKHSALRVLNELPDANIVCHNDIHMLNVIIHPTDSMIIDWMLATRGNPLADVAAAVLQLRFGEVPKGLLSRSALETGRAVFWRSYLNRYLAIRPVPQDELRRWELPVAVALAGRREGRMRRQLLQRIDSLLAARRKNTADVQT
jgi:aminoglycoside phosphotransferase (APT) family kinase protein